MLQATHFGDFPDRSKRRWVHRSGRWTIHRQRQMRAPVMVIGKIRGEEALQMLCAEHDHVIETLAADTPDEPFHVGILPRRPRGDHHLCNPYMLDPLPKGGPVDAIPIA